MIENLTNRFRFVVFSLFSSFEVNELLFSLTVLVEEEMEY